MALALEHTVGRAAELGLLDDALASLTGGDPATVLLLGEPGIGKTRLLAEAGARADAAGCIALSGSASELEADLPFWLFVDALDEYVAGLDPRRLASLEDDVRGELARVLPAVTATAPAGPAVQDERYRAHRAMRELLERVAATKPLVLVLDDVHWADPASIELLGALLRRPPSAAVLTVIGARPRQVPDRLATAFERAGRDGALTRIDLGPLDRADATSLLGEGVPPELAERLYDESGGNPFYLEQLARFPRDAETPAPSAPTSLAGVQVPATVAAALAEELALLAQPTRTFLEGAAVAGDPFEPDLASAAADVDDSAGASALDDLLRLDLVRRTDVPRRFRFRHPLVRRAVYDEAPGGWVLGAHERCAAALAGRGAAAPARAHHVEHAAQQGDSEAVAVLRDAGEATALRAPATAARWFGAALRLSSETGPVEERIGLLLARAQALAATGRLDEGRADLLRCIELLPDEASEMGVRLTVACAGVEHMLGLQAEAHARIEAALERLPDPASPEAASLMVVLAFDHLFRTDFDGMREAALRARDVATSLDDPALLMMTTAVLALACAWGARTEEAEAICSEAAGMVRGMSDAALVGSIDATAHLAAAELYVDRFDESAEHAERALAVGRATGQLFPTLVPTLASALLMRGELRSAAEAAQDGVEAARLAGVPQDLAWRLHVRSAVALAEGNVPLALRSAEEAVELTRGLEESFVTAYPALGLASARLADGDAAGAIEVLVASAGGEELTLIPAAWRKVGHEVLTRCHLELGQKEEAARAAGHAEAGDLSLATGRSWALRAVAAVALDAGDSALAAERALASAEAADGAGAVVEAALSRTLAGQALAQAGDTDAAVAALELAAEKLEACGATRYRDAAERELRSLGRKTPRRTAKGSDDGTPLGSLSERELQVARLVVDRRTNAEIAEELFLSVKTVESHMRNLFRKLGVSSRVDVARAVERAS